MFVTGWDGWVWALDAKTGVEIWRYKHAVPFDVSLCCGNVNRGVRGGQGEGLLRHGERPCARARRHERQARLGPDLRRRAGRGERHGRAAGREEHGHRGQLRRRVRRARPPRRVRRRLRRAPVALLHGPEARRARLRDLARRRRGLGAGRRELLAHRHLRPGDEPAVRGHRQPGARLRRRGARGRQPLHRQRRRRRRGQRPDPLALPVHPARRVGLRQHRRVHPVREGRAQAARALRQERLLLRPGPHERGTGLDHAVRGPDRLGGDHPGRPGDAPRRTPTRRGNRSTSTRVRPAPRNGPTRPTARRPSSSTSRSRTPARRPPGGAGSSRRASRTGARAFRWTSRTWRGPSARSTPTATRSGAGATTSRCARRCWPRAATWCSPGRPPGSSSRSTPAPGSSCGSSSAEAATTAARRPTASTAGSTSPCRSAGADGPRGSSPACSAPATEAR